MFGRKGKRSKEWANQWTNGRRKWGPSTSYKECFPYRQNLEPSSRKKNSFVLADLIHSIQRGRRRHARRSVLWWGRGAEVDGREHSGWPLHRLYGQQLCRVSDDIGPSIMGLRPGSHVCKPMRFKCIQPVDKLAPRRCFRASAEQMSYS